MFLRSLALVALFLVSSAALARPPMSTNQLVDDVGTPIGTPSNPLYTAGGGGGGGGGGASTVAGSMEQDVRSTGTLNAATANAAITTAINGQATVGYTFTGLTGSGATLTYEQSIDGGTTWTGINAVNRGTGVPEATRTTDGQIALSATGRTTIRVRVSTAGTGTITVATNVSVREGIFSLGSPLPPGGNVIGSVGQAAGTPFSVSANSTPNSGANPLFSTVVNFPTALAGTAPGTAGINALNVQGIPGGTPQPVTAGNDGSATNRAIRTTTTGVLEPPTAAAGKIVKTPVALSANASTQLVAANANRIVIAIQCASGGVSIDETGAALTGAGVGNGSLFIPANPSAYFTPPVATLSAVTAYTATAQTCSVTEYLR